jgi:hypothetical protein
MAAIRCKNALLDRHHTCRLHDDLELSSRQANHVPEDIPERPFAENTGRNNFARLNTSARRVTASTPP